MGEPLLKVRNVSKSYGSSWRLSKSGKSAERPALNNASFDLHRGEIVGIVGESGSGKTTLSRCISLLERPDSGSVFFKGEDLVTLSPRELREKRRFIQTVFQDPYASLNPRMKVGDALAEVLLVHGLVTRQLLKPRIVDLLDQVGLPATAADAYPSDFSGGQRQRICMARALAAEPDILIADEPVSSLDVSVQAQVVNLILDLRDRLGLSVIFIGHDLQLIDFIAPNIVVMLSGEIVETLDGKSTLADAQHEYTRTLFKAAPKLDDLAHMSSQTDGSEHND